MTSPIRSRIRTRFRGQSDAELVRAARSGDRGVFGLLITRHRAQVVKACRHMVGDTGLAEDAVQEASIVAMLNLDRLRRDEAFAAWLTGIALNTCRHWLRRGTSVAGWDRAAPGDAFSGREDPAVALEEHQIAARVLAAVRTLPAGQRKAVLLFYRDGLSYREAADALGVSIDAVRTRLYKGRRSLRRELARFGEGADMREAASGVVRMRVSDIRRRPEEGPPDRYVLLLREVGGRGRSRSGWARRRGPRSRSTSRARRRPGP